MKLATRGSKLALIQTELAKEMLTNVGASNFQIMEIKSHGDLDQTSTGAAMEGQGWFTTALEEALARGEADAAVHSAKDLPSQLAVGMKVAAYLERGDSSDAFVTRDKTPLDQLPEGAKVGTSSARREGYVKLLRQDLVAVPIRGNVDTRLRKLDSGEVDALLLASVGLDRLQLSNRITERLDVNKFVPAPSQGVIAIETMADGATHEMCARVNDPSTEFAVRAERAVLVALGGGCLLPLGALATIDGEEMKLRAAFSVGGELRWAEMSGPFDNPEELGRALALKLI